jgi:aminopeptidase N
MTIVAKRRLDYVAPKYTITHVELTFTLQQTATKVVSVLHLKRCGEHNEPLVLDGEKLTLLSLLVDGHSCQDYEQNEHQLIIPNVADEFTLTITNEINPKENKALEGLYLSQGVYCTQCEAEGFRRITYYLDRPDVLAIFTVTIEGEQASLPTMLSNGNPTVTGTNTDGTHWITWHDPYPKPAYLFALVAGDFDKLTAQYQTKSGKTVDLELYVDKGKKSRGEFALASLKRAMKWDEDVFGLEYDLDIYMIVAVDFFNMGAMENKGLNVFNSKFVLADQSTATDEDFFNVESVIAHEYFHNWTGNRVTCRDWFQLSLKEGLTVFRDQQFSSDMTSPLSNRIKQVRVMREHQFAEDASAMSHPIRPDEVIEMNNFYTVTVYDKGAEVIRMMHTLLGADGFRAGMDEYFKRHDGQAVTCDDFVAAMADANQVDFSHFATWYSQSGTPQLSVSRDYDKSNRTLNVTFTQVTPPTADQDKKVPLYLPVRIECIDQQGQHYQPDSPLKNGNVLIVDKASLTVQYTQVAEDLIPVVLGDFSAPVKLKTDLTPTELLRVSQYATDSFSRWDAMQQLYDWAIEQYYQGESQAVSDDIWAGIEALVSTEQNNHELLSECLIIPSFEALCQARNQIDVNNLYHSRALFIQHLVAKIAPVLQTIYQSIGLAQYEYTQSAVNARRCRNVVLNLLANTRPSSGLIQQQYEDSDNMSDTLGALKAAQTSEDANLFSRLMADFEQKWAHDALVLDKWFALHATHEQKDILSQLTLLREHPKFSQNNPNRVRSLIGSFAFYNTLGFHADDGSGYQYLTDYLLILDASNPQVASRLVTPLTQWQRYESKRQALMKNQLGRLLNHQGLSKDLFEKVSKSLAYECNIEE